MKRTLALLLAALAAPAFAQSGATTETPAPEAAPTPPPSVVGQMDEPGMTEPASVPPATPPAAPPVAGASRLMGPGPDADDIYGQRIGASYQAVENLQGSLDGSWTLVAADGSALFAFQLVDRPGGRDPLEGVWRDLRRPAVAGDINAIDSLQRGGQTLGIGFVDKPGAPPVAIALTLGPDGAWTGQLTEAGQVTQVRLRRS